MSNCFSVLPNLGQVLEVSPRTLFGMLNRSLGHEPLGQGSPTNFLSQGMSCPGARTSHPSWKRKEPGPPSAEPLVIWGGRGVDLTSCLNLALVEFFNRGYDPLSSLSQAFPTYSSNQFLALALILLFTLELWA